MQLQTSIAYQECELDEFAAVNITFNSLKRIKKELKSRELYAKFLIRLKNLLLAQVKDLDAKFIIYDDKFVLNFNKELSLATSSNKAVRASLKIVNAFTSLNLNVLKEFAISLNMNLTIIKKNSEDLQEFVSYNNNVKPLSLRKNDKKYLKGFQIILDQYIYDLISKDYKTDSLYSLENNGKTIMFYEILLDKYILPLDENVDTNNINIKKVEINNDFQPEEDETDYYSFNVLDINSKCNFVKTNAIEIFNKLNNLNLEKGAQILSLRSKKEYSLVSSELEEYFEKRDLTVLKVSCTEEMNYKPWGVLEALFRDYLKLPFHNGYINLSTINRIVVEKYKTLLELLFFKPAKAMGYEDARFIYMEQFSKFLKSLKNTVIIIDNFEYLDDTTIQTLELYFDKFKSIVPNFVFITNSDLPVHSKFKGLLRTNLYTEYTLSACSMESCLSTIKNDAADFIQSFYFEKIKANFKGSYLYFKNALEYLKDCGVLVEFENKLILKNKKSVILSSDIFGLLKTRIKNYAKNVDLSLILAYSNILGARFDINSLIQLGIKDVDKNIKMLQKSGLVTLKENIVYINNFGIIISVLKNAIKPEVNEFLAKNVIAQLGKGLDDVTMFTSMGILKAYKEEYLTLWKNSQFAINTGDYDAYLKNCLGFLSLIEYINAQISSEEIEDNKKEVYNNILLCLYAYSPAKIYFIENILLLDAIKNNDNEKIVKLSNLMLQGALLTSNYTDAVGLLHNIYSRMPEPILVNNGKINVKFLLLSLVNIEILYNIGDLRQCVNIGEEILSVISAENIDTIKPESFSKSLFITHLFDTFRLVALAKVHLLDDDIEDFFDKISQKFSIEFPEKMSIISIKDFLAGKVYSIENIENASAFSKLVYLLLQEFSNLKDDYKKFAQNVHKAKLLALEIHQREIELFCDILIAYCYYKLGVYEKAQFILDDILESSTLSALLNIKLMANYVKTLVLMKGQEISEALHLVNDSLADIQKMNNNSQILYALFEKTYLEMAQKNLIELNNLEYEQQKIDPYKEKLKLFFSEEE